MPSARCAAALLRRGGARGVGVRKCAGEAARRCPRCMPRGRVVPRWRRCAPPPPLRAAAPLPAVPALGRPARMQAGRGASGAVAVGGRGVGAGGSHPPQAPATRPPRPPPLTRVCVWGRRRVSAVQEDGAALGGLLGPRSLRRVAAQGGGRREPQGQGERWRRGPRRASWGGSGRGSGRELGEGALLTGVAPPLRAAKPPPSPPRGRPPPPLPSPLPVAAWRHGVGRRQAPGSHGGRQGPGEPHRLLRSAGRPPPPLHRPMPPPSIERGTDPILVWSQSTDPTVLPLV